MELSDEFKEMLEQRKKNKECYACGISERLTELKFCDAPDNIGGFICKRCAGNSWGRLKSRNPTEQLLPCPFCGMDAEMQRPFGDWEALCVNKKCPVVAFVTTNSELKTINRWNKRAEK